MISIDPSEIPDGSDYQLVTKSVMGDSSFSQVAEMEKTGWRRVPLERHPKVRSSDRKWIEDCSSVLMERPKYLTERARVWEKDKADAQLINTGVCVLTTRPINLNATGKRKITIREFFTKHIWIIRVWWRNKFIKEVSQ